MVSGVLQVSGINSALAELRCATGGLQTVLLALAWQKPLYLQRLAGLTNEICRRFCLLRDAHGVCEGVGSDGKISLICLADSLCAFLHFWPVREDLSAKTATVEGAKK